MQYIHNDVKYYALTSESTCHLPHAIDSWYIMVVYVMLVHAAQQLQLEQLKHLHSEIPPCGPMITHTSDSHQIPSQNKANQSYKLKIAKKSNLKFLQESLHTTHFL